MKFTHKLKFPNIGSFIFALFSYFLIILIIILFLTEATKNEGVIYTTTKNSYMDITLSELDVFNDDSVGKSEVGIVSKKNSPQQESSKNEIKNETKEIIKPKIQESDIKEITQEKPVEKKDVLIPETTPIKEPKKEPVDTKKLFESINFTQADTNKKPQDTKVQETKPQEQANLSNLFSSSTKDVKTTEASSSVTQNNEDATKNPQTQIKKGSSANAQKQGVYDPYFGEIQRRVELMWNRYRLPKIKTMPSIIITINRKGEVLKIDKKPISNAQYMDRVDDLIDTINSLKPPQFPAAPANRNFDSRIKIEINLGVLN